MAIEARNDTIEACSDLVLGGGAGCCNVRTAPESLQHTTSVQPACPTFWMRVQTRLSNSVSVALVEMQ